jgi:hypothetical protein
MKWYVPSDRCPAVQLRHVIGGETDSTGVLDRGMHAERHLLVNPVEQH